MPRLLAPTALLPLLLVATPAGAAVTKAEKLATCKIGAEDQKLEGAKLKAFMAKCMGKGNYEPAGRKELKKTAKKPAAKKPMAAKPMDKPMDKPADTAAPAPKQ